MEFLWLITLGLLAAGYFALAGYDYGVGVLLRTIGRDEPERRRLLGAVGPFFLGNEVWLVAFVGVLLGVFPKLEGRLFAGAYPVVVAILLGIIVFTAAVQLRSRIAVGRKTFWDLMIIVGASVTAIGWGVLLGNLLTGLPLAANGYPNGSSSGLLGPVSGLFGMLMFALLTLHGATFLALRSADDIARRAVRTARLLVMPCVAAVVAVVASGLNSLDVSQPALTLGGAALMIILLLCAGQAIGKQPKIALAFTATTAALPVLIVGTAHLPHVLVSSVDGGGALLFTDASSSAYTLSQVGWLALPVIPVVIGFQLMTWWGFRGRTKLFW